MSEFSTSKAVLTVPSASAARPRYGKIPAALAYSGYGRTMLYQLAGEHPGLFRKAGTSTLVDFDFLDRILDELPAAAIRSHAATR